MGARQTQGGEEPAQPATCAYQLPEWMENSLPKWVASDQTQTACWLPEWALIVWRLWLLQHHQPHRSPSASETILATRIPKTIWVSKEFLKCFKGNAIEVLIFQASGMGTRERKDDIFLACRMPLRWQHPTIFLLESIQVFGQVALGMTLTMSKACLLFNKSWRGHKLLFLSPPTQLHSKCTFILCSSRLPTKFLTKRYYPRKQMIFFPWVWYHHELLG